jgi:hypothetical protein
MGLFPRTMGKRFLRARTSASWGPIRVPVCPGEGTGRGEMHG